MFDLAQLQTVDAMTAQVVAGYQASDLIATFSEEETKNMMEKIVRSAEVTDEGKCGYHVLIMLYKDDVLLYTGYLAGDSCTEIGLESQYFHVESSVIEEIYKKLDYDMPVG